MRFLRNIKLSFWQTYSKPTSKRALEAFKTLKEVVKAVPEVDALVILGELESQVRAAMRFDEDVYELLPKNAKDVASTETEEERKTRKEFYRKAGGKIQVSIPERKRERGPRTSYSR